MHLIYDMDQLDAEWEPLDNIELQDWECHQNGETHLLGQQNLEGSCVKDNRRQEGRKSQIADRFPQDLLAQNSVLLTSVGLQVNITV